MRKLLLAALIWLAPAPGALSQARPEPPEDPTLDKILGELRELRSGQRNQQHSFDALDKAVDDVIWYMKLGEIAQIDKVSFTGPPLRYQPNPTGQGAGNPLIVRAYVFIPRKLDRSKKQPLLIFVHGGVHGSFDTGEANVARELLEQGYTIVAPEYRGSVGYGRSFYEAIDYGGLEIEDTFAARNWALENLPFLDEKQVGILGWSHGGLHTLMNIFEHPESYQVAYAGVPVSDLVARMGYKTDRYRELFSAPYHIGKSASDDVEEYRKRSPAWNAHKLQTPLLIHTNTNDEDVNVLEVEHLIRALKAEGKKFEYKIYQKAPGGHYFNRLDTRAARESRQEIYRFLARHLSPSSPVK